MSFLAQCTTDNDYIFAIGNTRFQYYDQYYNARIQYYDTRFQYYDFCGTSAH